MMRTQMGMAVNDYVSNIPNMSTYELGHDGGFLFEKVLEIALVSRGTSLTVNAARGSGMFGRLGHKMTTVGRWMSKAEYEIMAKTGRMVEGAGGQTFVSTGGSAAFNAAAKGSVYVEFDIPTNSLLQGGQANWFKVLGPNSGRAMQTALQKQGGQLLPKIQNLSPILKVK
jgi:hypothetical protein